MKQFLVFVYCLTALFSCKKEEKAIFGTWELAFVLADPGDGSGTFQAVDSERTMTFYVDGTYRSNAPICSMQTETGNTSEGAYSLSDSTLTVSDCMLDTLQFALDDRYLTFFIPCFEPCGLRFERK